MTLPSFQRHLHSSAGESGLSELLDRAEKWFGPLTDAWQSKDHAEGDSRLFNVLAEAITALDSFDLRPREIRLRPMTRAVDGGVPLGVICKLARSFIEFLAAGNSLAERNALESLAMVRGLPGRSIFEQGFRAALAELLFEDGAYDLALISIDANLKVQPNCPYSQHLLYRVLSKQKQAGAITGSPRIGLDDLSDRFCEHPFRTITTSSLGGNDGSGIALYACHCSSMLPYPFAGWSSDSEEKIEEIWNGTEIQEVRRSILEGDFTYCSRSVCPYILNGSLPRRSEITDPALRDIIDNHRTRVPFGPRIIFLAHDVSCNLACPSCRAKVMTVKNDARERMDSFVEKMIMPLMQDADINLFVSTDGDPIGSKHYRKLLHGLDPIRHRGVSLTLQSNGLLLTPREWESLYHIHPIIKCVGVSIDAAEATTYEDLRRPGKWKTLTENMEFLASLRRLGKIPFLYICFVVQKKNFEQMPAFVELGQHWSVDRVVFGKLLPQVHPKSSDWSEFEENAVVEENHPDHSSFLQVLKHPILKSTEVDLLNVASYLNVSSRTDVHPVISETNAKGVGSQLSDLPKRRFSLSAWLERARDAASRA